MPNAKRLSNLPTITNANAADVLPIVSNGVTSIISKSNFISALAQVFNVSAYGAVGDGVTDDTLAIRNAMNAALLAGGGTLLFGSKTYYINTAGGLAPVLNNNTNATVPVIFQGQGMQATVLKMGPNSTSGIFNNSVPGGGFPNVAQVTVNDMTLDGNYTGVNSGVIAQPASTPAGQLVTLPAPYTSAGTPILNGLYHYFNRVRFYRPSGYTLQGFTGVLNKCVFDQCGQPNVIFSGLHWDNIGNGDTVDVIADNCTWTNSSGNYADFTIVPAGKTGRLTMVGCKSFNHQIGGIYALGTGSVIAGNRLENVNTGSGVGYDASTNASNRSSNLVYGNTLKNMTVNASGLSTANGDSWYGNIATDSTVMQINGVNAVDVSSAQTLTNKSIAGSQITGNISGNAANVTGTVAVSNGGTGSSTQTFVDLSSNQTVQGQKTFGTNAAITAAVQKVLGYSDTVPLQEWGDGSGAIYLRIGRSSTNVMRIESSSVLSMPSTSYVANAASPAIDATQNGSGPSIRSNAGSVVLQGGTLPTTATAGFTYIPTTAGAPTGVPVAQAGTVPMLFDTTNNKLWIYNGAWKGVALA